MHRNNQICVQSDISATISTDAAKLETNFQLSWKMTLTNQVEDVTEEKRLMSTWTSERARQLISCNLAEVDG